MEVIKTADPPPLRRMWGTHRISAAIGPTNEASITVAKKLGLTCEVLLRDHVFTNGAWRDSLLFSVLAHEWTESQAYGRVTASEL